MQEQEKMKLQPKAENKVIIIACAGMDKALGSVARHAAFEVTEKLRSDQTVLVCIPPLVAGVEPYAELVKTNVAIIVDGCAERCATKIAVKSGAKIKGRVFIPLSAQKYGLKPATASNIGTDGEKLAEKVAEEIAAEIDKITGK